AVRLDRLLPALLRRPRRPASAPRGTEPGPAGAARLLGLARVLRRGGDLPERTARLPGSLLSARTRPVGRRGTARRRTPVRLADLDTGGRRRLPARVPC